MPQPAARLLKARGFAWDCAAEVAIELAGWLREGGAQLRRAAPSSGARTKSPQRTALELARWFHPRRRAKPCPERMASGQAWLRPRCHLRRAGRPRPSASSMPRLRLGRFASRRRWPSASPWSACPRGRPWTLRYWLAGLGGDQAAVGRRTRNQTEGASGWSQASILAVDSTSHRLSLLVACASRG